MKSLNTKVLTTYALFLAIMLIMAFVPGLGFIPTSVAAIVIIQVPVIIAPYSTSASSMVPRRWVMTINCVFPAIRRIYRA